LPILTNGDRAIPNLTAGARKIDRWRLLHGAFGTFNFRGRQLAAEADSAKLDATKMPAFKPETLAAIALALEMATADLAVVEPKLREAIEARIVAAAEATGEADPVKLCEAALNRA
jgi:hypothetical protein